MWLSSWRTASGDERLRGLLTQRSAMHSKECPLQTPHTPPSLCLPFCALIFFYESPTDPTELPDHTWIFLSTPQWRSCLWNQLEQVQGLPHLFLITHSPLFPTAWCSHHWRVTMSCALCSLSVTGWGWGVGGNTVPSIWPLLQKGNQGLEWESQSHFLKNELTFFCKLMSIPESKTPIEGNIREM